MIRLACLALLLARLAAAEPVWISGFDGTDATVNGTSQDSLEFLERGCAGTSPCSGPDGTADAEVTLVTSPVHDDTSVGSSSSRHALKSAPATGRNAYYLLDTPLPADSTIAVGASIHLDTTVGAGTTRTVLALLEAPNADPGCFVTIDENRQVSLSYGSTATSWGTTSTSSGLVKKNACTATPQWPCTAASVANDCPTPSDTCTALYWAGLEVVQNVVSASSVICELYVDGTPVFVGTAKTVSGASGVVDVAVGLSPFGTASVTGAATVYVDDLVLDDGGARAGYGYVATKYPSANGLRQEWVRDACKAAGTGDSTLFWECVSDYNRDRTGTGDDFTYWTATGADLLKRSKGGKRAEFLTGPALTLRSGETVTAAQLALFGRTDSVSATRFLQGALGVCPTNVCVSNACTNPGGATTCTTDFDCCVQSDGPVVTITSGASVATPTLWLRHLMLAPPAQVSGATWTQYRDTLALAWENGATETAETRVGAALAYLRVQKADARLQAITLQDHNVPGTPCTSDAQCAGVPGACVSNTCTNGQDGLITIATIGDSTLQGTAENKCSPDADNAGATCSQDTYCSWYAVLPCTSGSDCASGVCTGGFCQESGHADQPPGGCMSDAQCQTCAARRDEINGGAGYPCAVTNDCNLGTCSATCASGAGTCCSADDNVTCTVTGDCDLGTCDNTATCEASCPNGDCLDERAGWAGGLAGKIRADVVLICGQGGEDSGSMFRDRFPTIVEGRARDFWAGTGELTRCEAAQGTGRCQCSSSTDCGGGTCDATGHCASGGADEAKCTKGSDCNVGASKSCQFPRPDYIATLEGYNDVTYWAGVAEPAGELRSGFVFSEPHCTDPTALSQGPGNVVPPATKWPMCPQVGGSGAYACAATDCASSTACAALGGECVGINTAATAAPYFCYGFTNGPSGNFRDLCTTHTARCVTDADCATALQGSGMLCQPDGTGRLGRAQDKLGWCGCTTDGNCPTGFTCVGPTGRKLCRKSCTADAGCRAFSGTISSCDTGAGVCRGKCNCPCDAIPCVRDEECGNGYALTKKSGGLRTWRFTGTCNPARGRCAACGQALVPWEAVVGGPCSCAADVDCGVAGTCTNNVCVAGDAVRVSCETDSQCVPGQRCMGAHHAYQHYQAGHVHLALEVALRMTALVDGYPAWARPVLLFVGPPSPGGLGDNNVMFADLDATATYGGWGIDRAYLTNIVRDYLVVFPAHHVLDLRPVWDDAKLRTQLHGDQVHFSTAGSDLIEDQLAERLNTLNVCVQADGTAQGYCQRPSLTYADTGCGNPTTCPKLCDTDLDCAGDGFCVRRRCDGDIGNCPGGGGITCGAD